MTPAGRRRPRRRRSGSRWPSSFARDGYAATSLRQIARAADVDPALVIRYFGSKEALFIQTVPEGGPFDEVLEGPLDGSGERIVTFVFDGLDHSRFDVFLDVLRSASTEAIRQRMADMMEAPFSKLAKQLPGPDAGLRTRLVAAQVAGLLMAVRGSELALALLLRLSVLKLRVISRCSEL